MGAATETTAAVRAMAAAEMERVLEAARARVAVWRWRGRRWAGRGRRRGGRGRGRGLGDGGGSDGDGGGGDGDGVAAEMGMVEAPAATDTLLRHSAAGWGIPSSPLVGS